MDRVEPSSPRSSQSVRRARSGFTLVEVMVAFTILGIGLLSIAATQVQAIHGTQSGRHLTRASGVAQSQLEQLARSRWTALAPTAWTAPVTVVETVEDGAAGSTEQSYAVSWRIQNVTANETRSVDVRVTWTENDGRARTTGASTIVFNRENL